MGICRWNSFTNIVYQYFSRTTHCLSIAAQDMVAGPWDNERMENPLQGRCSVKIGGILSESVLCTQDPFPDYCGVKAVDRNTEGVFSQVLLTKLNLGGTPVDNSALLAPTSHPRSSRKWFIKHSIPRPVTALELPCSPVQPKKKLRGTGVMHIYAGKVEMIAGLQNVHCSWLPE